MDTLYEQLDRFLYEEILLYRELIEVLKKEQQSIIKADIDSLWKIANRFGTTTNALKSFNHMQTTRLDIGQVIFIP
jgi:hypothetical protein